MSEKDTKNNKQSQPDPREKRRAEQLRANLMRRKVQSRSRRAGDADERNDGITAGKQDQD
ncbi:hypothetical protein [Brucella pseudogrignonensis]|uniref:Uncharacterized protein n=1 Tax=Brucella pseudogrignonensis TaxID=419475 RepID=A0ABU1M709_9HYPH|nr:hypothetical protein [Brucella pseudogrignonensis]MDR6431829.1 hypothetical protein [Brucella pseudogrignonensis]